MEDSDKLELEIEAVARNWFTRWFATICFFLGMGAAFWAFSAPNKPIDPDIEVKVRGLVCPSCAIGIKNGLKKTKLIKVVKFDIKKEVVLIEYISIEIHPSKIKQIVKNAGYEVSSIRWLKKKQEPRRYNKP